MASTQVSEGCLKRVRTFAVRKARMSKLQKRALQELSGCYGVPEGKGPLDLPELFGKSEPQVIYEIGFGMGYATAELAARYPELCFLGVEVYPPGVGKLLSEVDRRELKNVRVARADAVVTTENRIPDASLRGVHVFFPDPWPKRKHHKRRLMKPWFAALLAQKLTRGGYLYVTTDWEDYAYDILEAVESVPELHNPYRVGPDAEAAFAAPQPWRPRTSFETKGAAKQHPIWEVFVERTGGPH